MLIKKSLTQVLCFAPSISPVHPITLKLDFELYNTIKGKCFIFINNSESVICEHFLDLFYRIYKSLMN